MRVCFPDGTAIQALSLRERKAHDSERDYGLYLDRSWAPTWDACVIAWEDFGLPADNEEAAHSIIDAFRRAKAGEAVEIGCIGGLGRTGTVLACMAVLSGVPRSDAVDWVRANYHRNAVETEEQAAWVLWFAEQTASDGR